MTFASQLESNVADHIAGSTVLIQAEGLDPGSGVLLKKDNDRYYVLTAVLGRLICTDPDNVEEDQIEIMTSDGVGINLHLILLNARQLFLPTMNYVPHLLLHRRLGL